MRPVSLELEGFTAFRERTTISFEGADYFALVGPTGAGKSSIVDAMTFALYGSVPRLDRRSVHPIISEGRAEAKIRFDFSVGESTYTAVRWVRRMANEGASTKEARLERGEEVLAGTADEVTAAVERLLGLTFDQFTRCVVLPQGEFQRFMHDKPRDRQDLLVHLLDLGVYGLVGQAANQRATAHETAAAVQAQRLEDQRSFATPEALADANERLARLEALFDRIERDEPELEALRAAVRTAQEEETAVARRLALLDGLAVPAGVAALARADADAAAAVEAATERAGLAARALEAATKRLEDLPDPALLRSALAAHDELAALRPKHAAAAEAAASATGAAEAAAEAAAAATARWDDARDAVELVRVKHGAAAIAAHLHDGDECPVCLRRIDTLPERPLPEDLESAEQHASAARAQAEAAAAGQRAAEQERARATAQLEALAERLAEVEVAVATHPDAEAIRASLEEAAEAERQAKGARAEEKSARAELAGARARLGQVEASTKAAWDALQSARDRVAELAPPPLGRSDLAADWEALSGWAAEQRGVQQEAGAAARRARAEATEAGTAIRGRQRAACAELGIDGADSPRDACLKTIEATRGAVEKIELALEEIDTLTAEIAALTERTQVAKTLGAHLRANAFERWMLDQAMTSLADGAGEILRELSGEQYSLTLDKHANFAVIDHRNADTERSARTLSGGETFLASLALALTMSDRIASLSASGAVRLESIFLDEGFGALDPETLDVVAGVIENLAARDRTVGLITHVRALADQVPVRFEVTKLPHTSVVERVEA